MGGWAPTLTTSQTALYSCQATWLQSSQLSSAAEPGAGPAAVPATAESTCPVLLGKQAPTALDFERQATRLPSPPLAASVCLCTVWLSSLPPLKVTVVATTPVAISGAKLVSDGLPISSGPVKA